MVVSWQTHLSGHTSTAATFVRTTVIHSKDTNMAIKPAFTSFIFPPLCFIFESLDHLIPGLNQIQHNTPLLHWALASNRKHISRTERKTPIPGKTFSLFSHSSSTTHALAIKRVFVPSRVNAERDMDTYTDSKSP